jgi:hypothetical protein
MGLVKCFEAESLITYEKWWLHESPVDSDDPAVPPPDWPCVDWKEAGYVGPFAEARYNPGIMGSPFGSVWPFRRYAEEIAQPASRARPGAVWGAHDPNRWDQASIKFLSNINQIYWPSWATRIWRFDAARGRSLGTFKESLGSLVVLDQFTVEPDGSVWWFGPHADAYHGGPKLMSLSSDAIGLAEVVIPTDTFEQAAVIEDFGLDRAARRAFVRRGENTVGQVTIYDFNQATMTATKVADIYTPNATAGIAPTLDGFVYVADVLDWICVYDYDGNFHGAYRNPRPNAHLYGAAYGWDQAYKRLLRVVNTPVDGLGASTLRIEGFYPVSAEAILTPPIPRQVPRKNRGIFVFSHLCGEGGEPLTGRHATLEHGGAVVGEGATDTDGDVAIEVTPAAAGPYDAETTV